MTAALLVALSHWLLTPMFTCLLLLVAGQILTLANAEKLRYTGDAILWQDITYALPNAFSNLGTVWQYVGPHGLLAAVSGGIVLTLVRGFERSYILRSLPMGIGFSAVLTLFYLPSAMDFGRDIATDIAQFKASAKSFAGNLHTRSLARFLHSASIKPAIFQAQPGNSRLFQERSAGSRLPPPSRRSNTFPDIFVVLNESQFDPVQIQECIPIESCRMELFASGQNSVMRGPLRVHTHGWGTWNAEFTLMTGIPYFWFGENGFYSPYTTAPRVQMALPSHLGKLGYRTIGIYPTQKGMLNAALAYRQYGIQEFYGAEDLGLSWDWCNIPDRLMYEKLMEKYQAARKEDDRPILMVMLTIFNHGPHGERCMATDSAAKAGHQSNKRQTKLRDYLERSKAADNASSAFRSVSLAIPRPVLLLFAGDHQPSFEGLAATFPRRMHRPMPAAEALLFTNYQFFANYDIPTLLDGRDSLRELDISFLAATLLDLAMLPQGQLFDPNIRLRELCDGRLESCSEELLDSYKSHLSETGFYQ